MNSEAAVLWCTHLTKTYVEAEFQVPVLHEVNFSVAPGERVAIIGLSGAGKSTFLQLLGGLDRPTSGEVWIGDKNISTLSEREKGRLRNQQLGFVYQFHHLLPEFNALENVAMPLLIRGLSPKSARSKALDYIEKVGLLNRQTHRVAELSGGERQRIAIARALVTEPRCVLADEPTGNLDQETAEQITLLICQLSRTLNISFVIVTHNRSLATQMDRVLVLKKGQLYLHEET
jgi:lipoprotein-releasing system ATP-binding protein